MPAAESRSKVWMPTFRFLMLGMSRLAIRRTSSASSTAEHDVVEVRGHVDDDVVEHRAQHAHHADHLFGRDPLTGGRLDRRTQHPKRRCFVRGEEPVHELRVDRVDDRSRVGGGVLRGHTEEHRVVTELEVGVDVRPGPDYASRAAPRGWSRRRSCRHHPWWRTQRTCGPTRAGSDEAATARFTTPDMVSPTRSTAARIWRSPASIVSASRTPTAQRVLEQREGELVGEQHNPDLGVGACDPLHRREAIGAGQARAEHEHGGLARDQLAGRFVDRQVGLRHDPCGARGSFASAAVRRVRPLRLGISAARTLVRARRFHHSSSRCSSCSSMDYGTSAAGGRSWVSWARRWASVNVWLNRLISSTISVGVLNVPGLKLGGFRVSQTVPSVVP